MLPAAMGSHFMAQWPLWDAAGDAREDRCGPSAAANDDAGAGNSRSPMASGGQTGRGLDLAGANPQRSHGTFDPEEAALSGAAREWYGVVWVHRKRQWNQ